jgi:hypothetical protein
VRAVTPTMRALMDDPIFKAYMKKIPRLHHANTYGDPWQVWVRTLEGKWRTGQFPTYRDVWPVFVKALRTDSAADVCLTSRRVFYAPPGEWRRVKVKRKPTAINPSPYLIEQRWRQTFQWDAGLEWCGRCRRPSYWMPLHDKHHALRRQPAITYDDNERCVYCGIRWIAMPSVDDMEKVVL